MYWYKTGTIAATNGSKIITGTGTQFTNSLNGVAAGRMLLLPAAGTVQIYEIESVQSDTQLTLVSAFTGTTGTGKAYAIPTSPAVSIEQFAHEFASTLAYYQQQLSGWQQILTGTGNVTLTTPDGQTVTVRSQQAWDAALDGKADDSDIAAINHSLTTKMSNGQFGVGGQAAGIPADVNVTDYFLTLPGGFYSSYLGGNTGIPTGDLSYDYIWNPTIGGAYGTLFATGINSGLTYINSLKAGIWSGWYEAWTDRNLVKQIGQFDATAGSVMLNGAWGWGGSGYTIAWDDDTFYSWARDPSSGSRVFRNNNANGYTKQYGAGIFVRASDTWMVLSAGVAASGARYEDGIQIVAGTNDGRLLRNYEVWTDKNIKPVKDAPSLANIGDAAALHSWALNPLNVSSTIRNDAITPATSRFGSGIFSKVDGTYSIITVGPNSPSVKIQAGDGSGYINYDVWTDKNLPYPATLDTAQTITGEKQFKRNNAALRLTPVDAGAVSYILSSDTDNSSRWILGYGDAGTNTLSLANYKSNSGVYLNQNGDISINPAAGKRIYQWQYPVLAAGLNAVADSNGFYKTASPVVKLFSNGTSELTSEAEGITTERLSEGVYRISGCLGLNADRAWGGDDGGIDVPMCRNKLPRLWVDYGGDEGSEQINPDGSIVIRTYHRPHPDAPAFARNEIEGYANGDPIDIPHDTFISVRVQMPEVEVQEAVVETLPNQAENEVVLETSTQA